MTEAVGTADQVRTEYEYDSQHNLISVKDPKGSKTYYSYITDDRVQSANPINKVQNANFEVDAGADGVPDFWS